MTLNDKQALPATRVYKATIDIYIAVDSESEACAAIAETMRPHLKRFEPNSCLLDWRYNPAHPYPRNAAPAEIEALEK
jgi:hypothetical protein